MIEQVQIATNQNYEEGKRCLFQKGPDRMPFWVTIDKLEVATRNGRRARFQIQATEDTFGIKWNIAFFLDISHECGAAGNCGETLEQLREYLLPKPSFCEPWRQEIGTQCC